MEVENTSEMEYKEVSLFIVTLWRHLDFENSEVAYDHISKERWPGVWPVGIEGSLVAIQSTEWEKP